MHSRFFGHPGGRAQPSRRRRGSKCICSPLEEVEEVPICS